MTSSQLLKKARAYPIFSLEDCAKWFPEMRRPALHVRLTRSVAETHLVRLKRGLYLLNEEPFPHPFAIASRLDPQTIISLETVLNREGLMPDIPFATTAVTTQKTARYTIKPVGTFLFRHIKAPLVFGFKTESYPPYTVRVAQPEKALCDLLWFHRFERNPEGYAEELRLSIPNTFSWRRFRQYAKLFSHDGMSHIAQAIIKHYQ